MEPGEQNYFTLSTITLASRNRDREAFYIRVVTEKWRRGRRKARGKMKFVHPYG